MTWHLGLPRRVMSSKMGILDDGHVWFPTIKGGTVTLTTEDAFIIGNRVDRQLVRARLVANSKADIDRIMGYFHKDYERDGRYPHIPYNYMTMSARTHVIAMVVRLVGDAMHR